MAKPRRTIPNALAGCDANTEQFCRDEIDRMLRNSHTKVIMPVVTLGLLVANQSTGKTEFTDAEIRQAYEATVRQLTLFLGHDVHIGAKYYDAYGTRMSRYGVLNSIGHLVYELTPPYLSCAKSLAEWIPSRIREHITDRLGIIPTLGNDLRRLELAADATRFLELVRDQIGKTPANFEIFSFAVIKVHLEKFACRIYRDTRTSAHDRGVDLATNFGVVYQVKKLRLLTQIDANRVYEELQGNFDTARLHDGNVVLVIDDIAKDVKKYLIDMRVQSITREDLLNMGARFEDVEDRQKVLRIVYDEFRREYSSSIR